MEFSFEAFRDFLKSLDRDQIQEIQQILLDQSYQQKNSDNAGLQPSQES